MISTSEIKVSVLIDEEYTELALRALHTAYGLDAAGDEAPGPPGRAVSTICGTRAVNFSASSTPFSAGR